jgi:hypothetical protein
MLGRFRERFSKRLCDSLEIRSSRGPPISRDLARESKLLDRGGRRPPRSEKLDKRLAEEAPAREARRGSSAFWGVVTPEKVSRGATALACRSAGQHFEEKLRRNDDLGWDGISLTGGDPSKFKHHSGGLP